MQCAKCGSGNRSQARFCEECGTPLTLACPQCRTPVLVGKKFCGDCGAALFSAPLASAQLSASRAPSTYAPAHPAARRFSRKSVLEGERKVITVLFADIKGSMDILEGLDPEESKNLLDPCLQLMMDAVHRAGGTVTRALGDGIMALFGAPLALEDHPHHALHAALRMQDTVRRHAAEIQKQYDIELQIRIGINTGEVVVGAIGDDLFMEYTPVGHAVGLAARMESLAAPGSTLVTASTYRFTEHAFRFTARGYTKVKGATEPLAVYELLGPEPSHTRLTARATYGLTPFIGRSRELARLEEIADKAASGQGQIIQLDGEAGIGKSRLIEELKPHLQTRGFLLIGGEGFAYGKTRAYLPLINMLKRYCGITEQDTPASYREKLQAALTGVDASLAPFVPLFLDLLGVEDEEPTQANLSAEAKLKHILDGVQRLIALQCRTQPVALVVEDLHWLDARSITFLHALMLNAATIPLFLLCSSRPDQLYPWDEHSFVQHLQLTPLPQEDALTLFSVLIGSSANTTLAATICERSGGNPFFLEEIVQNLHETGALAQQESTRPLPPAPIRWTLPATVQGVLASRLDRLPPAAKLLLQTASVIGRDAPRSLLTQVTDLSEAEFAEMLHLVEVRDFLHESTFSPESIYSFKHALTQEVAYHGLLQAHRTALHEQVGDAMEKLYAAKLPEYASLLAYHYQHSANTEKTLHYLALAGQRASALYADDDAQYFWGEGLRLLARQPRSPQRDRQEIRTRLALINVLSRRSNDDTPIRAQFAAAETVCRQLQDESLLAELHATLAVAYILRGRPRRGLPHARAAQEITEAQRNVHLQAITAGPLAHLLWISGSFTESLHVADAGARLIEAHDLSRTQMGFIIHPHAHCFAIAGVCRGFLGEFAQGINLMRTAASLTKQHGNQMSQAVVHWGLALLFDLYGQTANARKESGKALTIMEEVSPTTGVLLVGPLHEYLVASSRHSPLPTSPPNLLRAWQEQLPFHELAGIWLSHLAIRAERFEEARQFAREALAKAEENGSSWFLYTAHLATGKAFAAGPEETGQAAEKHLQAAFDLATRIRSLPFLAHATIELGELLFQHNVASHKEDHHLHSGAGKQASTFLSRSKQYGQQAVTLGEQLGIPDIVERGRRLLTRVS